MSSKTVREYLEGITDQGIRDQALKNMYKDYQHEYSKSLPDALFRAFLWHKSPEGYSYWKKVQDSFKSSEQTVNLPQTDLP